MISFNKVIVKVSIFFSIAVAAAAAAATDETAASTPSSTKRELKGDAEVSYGSYDGGISMSYATSAKAAKTKSAKANDASSEASKAKVSKSYSYSMSYGPGCERSKCVDPDVPRFIVDRSVDIGDTLLQKEPDMPKRCGCDCYTIKDSGDKPPFDLQLGDTQRFAYRKVTSTNFSIKSRTCGVKCYVGDEIVQPPIQLDFGRVGLEVRQSLDPFSANVFISHVPQLRAEWSGRENDGTPFGGVDYSLDVTCLWITLTRKGDKFTWTYAYDAYLPGEKCESGDIDLGFDPVEAVNMSETVYVGLAVSSEVYSGPNSSCEYTEADFESIEFVCEGDSC